MGIGMIFRELENGNVVVPESLDFVVDVSQILNSTQA